MLGVANAKLRWRDHVLTGGRLELSAPFVNGSDSRMIPNTFEGILFSREAGDLRYGAAYLSGIKLRNADEFVSMAVAAGATGSGGVASVGGYWNATEELYFGLVDHFASDLFNTLYAEAGYTLPFAGERGARLELQFTDQRSVGRAKLGAFETWNFAVRAAGSALGGVVRLGFSMTADPAGIRSPWGSNPSYVDLMQRTFERAGEKALLASISWDLDRAGLPGLTAILNFARGWDARDAASLPLPGSREVDVTVDYRVPAGWFKGFWMRVRGSWLGENHNREDGADFRVIFNYDLPVFLRLRSVDRCRDAEVSIVASVASRFQLALEGDRKQGTGSLAQYALGDAARNASSTPIAFRAATTIRSLDR